MFDTKQQIYGDCVNRSTVIHNTKLIISVAYGPDGRKNTTNHMLDGIIKVYLNDNATVYNNITVYQRSAEAEKEFAILNYSGGTSSKVPAMGGTVTLYVKSSNGLWEITDADGLTITPMSGGNSSEEPIKVVVPASQSVEEYTITAKQLGTNDEATYSILLDASVTNSIVLVDENGKGQTSVSAKGGVKALKVYASGPWAVTTNQSWITPYNKTNYPWSSNSGTGPNGATIYFQINGSVAPRSSYIKASLTGEDMTGYTSTLTVYQSGQSEQSGSAYSGTYEAFFNVYGEYAPVGTSIVPIEGTSDYGVALVFHASQLSQNIAWCMPEASVNEYSSWLHISTYSPETINGTSYYVHYIPAPGAWYYIAADVDALPENMDYRIAEIPIDVYTMDTNVYITTVYASLVQERSETGSDSATITTQIVGGTDEFAYNTRNVTINATCTSVYVNTKWTAYIGEQTTDIIPTINGSDSDTGDVPDNNIVLALQFAADNTSDVAKTTQVVIKCQNKFSERTLKTAVVSFARLPEDTGGGEGGDDEPIIPDDPTITWDNNYVYMDCSTYGASIYYSTGHSYGPFSMYTSRIEISEDTTFYAYSMLDGERSENIVSETAIYDDGGQGGGDEPVEDTYTVTASNLTIDPDGGSDSTTVTIEPSASWNYDVISGGWFTVSTSSAGITVNANKNATGTNRTGSIKIYVVGYQNTYFTTITVSQNNSTTPEPGPDPIVRPAAPVFSQDGNSVSIACSTSGASIYYGTNGSQPDTLYTGPIAISSTTTFSAYSTLNGVKHSDDSNVSYTATYTPPTPQYYLTLESDSLETNSTAASAFFGVSSNVAWTATASTGITIESGSDAAVGDGTVTFSYDANSSTSQSLVRTITVSADNSSYGLQPQVFTLTQDPAPVIGFEFTDGNGNPKSGVRFEDGYVSDTIYVTCNTSWHVSSSPDWVDITNGSGTANETVAVTVTRNSSTYTQDGQIVFTALGGTTDSVYCTVDESPVLEQ